MTNGNVNVVRIDEYSSYRKEAAEYQRKVAKKATKRKRQLRRYAKRIDLVANIFLVLAAIEFIGAASYIETLSLFVGVVLMITITSVLAGVGILLKVFRHELMER